MKPFLKTCRIDLPKDNSCLPTVRAAFANAERAIFRQAWLTEQEPAFRPASVATGWSEGEFLVFAELEDDEIYTEASGLNDETWEKGDVFEMFLRNMERTEYQELHIAPNNCKFQIRVPNDDELQDRDNLHAILDRFMLVPEVFQSRVWVEPGRWSVFARIPFAEMQLSGSPEGRTLAFSFGRYDYSRGSRPVVSSTSEHLVFNFHRQHEWGRLIFS